MFPVSGTGGLKRVARRAGGQAPCFFFLYRVFFLLRYVQFLFWQFKKNSYDFGHQKKMHELKSRQLKCTG